MPSYPVSAVSTPDGQVNVLQITDLHLSSHVPASADETSSEVAVCQYSFEAIIKQALSKEIRCDLIIVTGDLVNKVEPAIYDHIFTVLKETGIPFACIAGNHDVTDEMDEDLPFYQRTLIARASDPRLLSRHLIESEHWQLLLLDSSITGKVEGEITSTDIDWVREQLAFCAKPALIALHHHVLPVDSEWIDSHMAENAEEFWQHITPFENLSVIINGHTHQEQTRHHQGVTVYSTPSTCYQFKPFEDNFAYDKNMRPGYRWLQLANNGKVASWVERLDT